jgi:BirA family biotin operon repressor/biotin-[acetyl-CoA-carboxylase] ligase
MNGSWFDMAEDNLSADLIMEGLETRLTGQRVLYYPSVTSTNEVAKQEAGQGAAEGTVIIAGEQTRGRGRMKRTWLTPEGNIALSVVLYPDASALSSLIMLASLAVVHSIESVTGLETQIKWPNDVMINGKKVCGILVESDVRGGKVNYAVIGIGINVNLKPEDSPEIQTIATSLSGELGVEVSRFSIVRHLLVELERLYLTLSPGGSVYAEWRDRLITLGKEVKVTDGENIYEGLAESVDKEGSLLLRIADGSLKKIVTGDVTLRN